MHFYAKSSFSLYENHHTRLRIITPINAAEICFMVDHNNLFTIDFQKVVKRLYCAKTYQT